MTEEKNSNVATVSEPPVAVQETEQKAAPEEQKMVPLSALHDERRRRQELQEQNRTYQEMLAKQELAKKADDDEAWVSRGEVKKEKSLTKQEILEQVFVDSNPEKMNEINSYLEKIVERKPWLAQSVAMAENRYSRAYEIVQDYKHLVAQQKKQVDEAQKIVENSKKPGSPVNIAKTSNPSKGDYLLSVRGTKDFQKYRKDMLKGAR